MTDAVAVDHDTQDSPLTEPATPAESMSPETGDTPAGAPAAGGEPPQQRTDSFEPAALRPNGAIDMSGPAGSLSLLHDVDMEVTVELGRTTMAIRDLLALQPGMVIEIERDAGAPIDVLVNGRLIACGEVVVIDEEFGIRITEIVAAEPNP